MDWPGLAWDAGRLVAAAVVVYAWLLALTRLAGLRSFSRMSGFDFAVTVATGTALASTILAPQTDLWRGIVTLGVLFGLQVLVAHGRVRWRLEKLVDNRPLLLMDGPDVVHDNLRRARLTEPDLMAKLREHSVARIEEVAAVVFETTGTVSVIKGQHPIEPRLLARVRGGRLATAKSP